MATAAKRMEAWVEPNHATDPRWVLEDDVTMPESVPHGARVRLVEDILSAWVVRTGRNALVTRNLALRWEVGQPAVGVDPDVVLIEPAPPDSTSLQSLCTWKPGHHPPRVAVEVVSENTAAKDYGDGPRKYALSGTGELWIFDPDSWAPKAVGSPWVLQVWRRDPRGRFTRRYAGEGPAYSKELGAWLVVTDQGQRLRIADDRDGKQLWLTIDEQERAEKLAERAEKLAERAAKEAALSKVALLQAEIERLRGK